MDQVKFVKAFKKFEVLKDCLPQILLGPFLNTSFHIELLYRLIPYFQPEPMLGFLIKIRNGRLNYF